ncbi:MAG: hypothetical protein AzoDbin1_01921 [Azoarcus sp.]|nr:hypothetical protein [Azoarcus sp.]
MKKLVLVLLAAGLTQSATAGFIDQSSSNPFADNPQMRVIGAERFEDLPGFAREVPLHEALTQIVPRNYTVRSRGLESIQATIVSWQGGKGWNLVLKEVLDQVPALQAEIDTSSKIVTFGLAAPSSTQAIASATEGGTAMPVATPDPQWFVTREDSTVRGVLERWSKHAGWQLVWEIDVDYPVEAEASITSQFEIAVETLTKSLQGADVPPKAIIYRGNRVLRVVARGTE